MTTKALRCLDQYQVIAAGERPIRRQIGTEIGISRISAPTADAAWQEAICKAHDLVWQFNAPPHSGKPLLADISAARASACARGETSGVGEYLVSVIRRGQ